MQFGIFYEHQFPRPWAEGGEQQLIADALDQIALADSLGIDYVWEVEHHFLEEYSHSSAPEVFLAAASQRTTKMRLGHGIVQTAPAYNHPARIAERIAMLDLVSGGRVEFGSGESSSEAELGGFGIDPVIKREAWLEGLEVSLRCLTETPFTGVEGQVRDDATAKRRTQARAEAPSPAVGGLQPARHDPASGREGHGRPHLRLHRARGGPAVGGRLRVDATRPLRARRPRREPAAWPACHPMMCARDEYGGHRPGPRGRQLLRLLAGPLSTSSATTCRARPTCGPNSSERRGKMGYSPEAAMAATIGDARGEGGRR